jgi:hypothetical protein
MENQQSDENGHKNIMVAIIFPDGSTKTLSILQNMTVKSLISLILEKTYFTASRDGEQHYKLVLTRPLKRDGLAYTFSKLNSATRDLSPNDVIGDYYKDDIVRLKLVHENQQIKIVFKNIDLVPEYGVKLYISNTMSTNAVIQKIVEEYALLNPSEMELASTKFMLSEVKEFSGGNDEIRRLDDKEFPLSLKEVAQPLVTKNIVVDYFFQFCPVGSWISKLNIFSRSSTPKLTATSPMLSEASLTSSPSKINVLNEDFASLSDEKFDAIFEFYLNETNVKLSSRPELLAYPKSIKLTLLTQHFSSNDLP